jgi:branched-chain amino acid transport system substrate-binding protein
MRRQRSHTLFRLAGCLSVASLFAWPALWPGEAFAQQQHVVGVSVGLTGYTAQIDQAWADGVAIGADLINTAGGVLDRKIKVIIQDSRSQVPEAVATFNNMLSERAEAVIPGCFSAGNFAAAPILVRRKVPMIVCSILPAEENLANWMFSTIPRPEFEVEPRLAYLKQSTNIRKIGVIYDQSPYANVQTEVTKRLTNEYGLEIVGIEQYQQTDSDLSVQLKKLQSTGAQAIIKNGNGATTLLAARAIKELGLSTLLLTSNEDLAVFHDVSKVMGGDFYFPVNPAQLFDTLSDDDPAKKAIGDFLLPWRKKYGERDPSWAARGYDAIRLLATALAAANSTDGAQVRDALAKIHRFQGSSGIYSFDVSHYGLTDNPLKLGHFVNGKLVVAK